MAGQELAQLRRERGLTQTDLAARSEVSVGAIQKIEAGRQRAQASTRRRLCKALRWPYKKHAELFGPLPKPGRQPAA